MDFAAGADFTRLFAWLDSMGAKECGEGVAAFRSDADRSSLENRLRSLVSPRGVRAPNVGRRNRPDSTDPRARLYLVGQGDNGQGTIGRFISGGRKRPPWDGWATNMEDIEESDPE